MPAPSDQIVTVAQMRAGEEALIAAGTSVEALMLTAGRGAAEWVWRAAACRPVTVLCGPGNNGGDGYVLAEAIREKGGTVHVVAACEPRTDSAKNARALFGGEVLGPGANPKGEVLVDCLFGSGLTRPLSVGDFALLSRLSASHTTCVAIDLASGVDSDTGIALNEGLPDYALTVALGAWKYAHFLMPAAAKAGALRLVGIGLGVVPGAAQVLRQPRLAAPAADEHKYKRGLLGVVGGEMPGAAVLAAKAAQGAGAGYVKLLCERHTQLLPPDLVTDTRALEIALDDRRWASLLVGPGLGRDDGAIERLTMALEAGVPTVIDADALMVIGPDLLAGHRTALIATPHEGELVALERAFECGSGGSRAERARTLAGVSGMVIVAKGPDTIIAAPDGRLVMAPRASSWLSTAGTGDVLAGTIASRLACGIEAFEAACQGVWLHGAAARRAGPVFTAGQLAAAIASAYAACL
ncbi:MAG: NAD(P)H-hydrate epimerase [Novosphingobium sp.]